MRNGYLATLAAVAAGSFTAGVIGLVLGLPIGLVILSVTANVLSHGRGVMTTAQTERTINLIPVIIGAPCMALCTALAGYLIIERRNASGWVPKPLYDHARATVWAIAVLNTAAFAVIGIAFPRALLKLIVTPWLWPLYIVAVGVPGRWAAMHIPDSGRT